MAAVRRYHTVCATQMSLAGLSGGPADTGLKRLRALNHILGLRGCSFPGFILGTNLQARGAIDPLAVVRRGPTSTARENLKHVRVSLEQARSFET